MKDDLSDCRFDSVVIAGKASVAGHTGLRSHSFRFESRLVLVPVRRMQLGRLGFV